jgi:hypothetical protein
MKSTGKHVSRREKKSQIYQLTENNNRCYWYVLLRDMYPHTIGRSQWPRGIRHELSSPARTLGSWIRIPLKARMSAFILCFCFPLLVGALRRAVSPSKESYRRCIVLRKLKKKKTARAEQRTVQPLMDGWMDE